MEKTNSTINQNTENETSFEEFRELYEKTLSNIEEGNIVTGRIVKINPKEVLVDINYKSEGIIPIDEFPRIDEYKIGDEVEVFLESLEDEDGMMLLSKSKVDKSRNWERTIAKCNEGALIEGKIFKKVKGGFMVDIGVEAFLPASQVDIKHIPDMDAYVGKSFDFKILKINEERKNVVISRRELLEEERARERARLIAEINEGDLVKGIVKNITDFGAFIDLNGIDGLLHITDMTWGRISHPQEMLSIGNEVEVMVLKFDKNNARISLGLKQKSANPWDSVEAKYPVSSIVTGKVVNIMPYGAFVELEEGIEGLIHISEFSWTKRINHPSEVLNVGDSVEAMVLNIEKDKEKISLGIKQTEFNPWSVVEEKYPEGKRVTGTIRNITSYGAFVELEEGIDGLIHISDISWTKKINNPAEVLHKGDTVDSVVLSVDKENKKIALGIKQLKLDPWENIEEKYNIGDVVSGVVSKVAGFGIFVTLDDDLEGLIHATQLSETPPTKVEDVVKVGQEITAVVVKIDPTERKIALSVKELLQSQKREEEAVQKKKEKSTLKEYKKREASFESTSILSEQLDEVFKSSKKTDEKKAAKPATDETASDAQAGSDEE
ncbi:MAG: 30S ribosomal protein S1 [Candidatus Auribacterota bacterium]|jgi:small subunit ribosomal protein S1|uniref:30S ribosomal protein S1 n=1 Tax=Candidatus Auribacter fodinae TaxID=2093366 RepID=A0A3A4QQB3_9BACT|nr:MAG: 30S ribosomal protein S1 [Candidatus Auribacter fodinae]